MTPLILSALLLLANAFASSQANGSATPPNAFATYQANEGAGLQRSEAPHSNATPRSGQPAVHPAAGLSGAPHRPAGMEALERGHGPHGPTATGASRDVDSSTRYPEPSGAPLTGTATWYDAPSRTDAAAGPALRDLLGPDWRGSWVTVTSGSRSANVRLTDACACGDRNGQPTLLDLDDEAFAELAPLSRGVVRVTVERLGDIALPETSTDG